MKRIFLLAACASMTACAGHLASPQISELDEVRAMVQQAKDAGAEKCAPALQAKAVAGLYHAAHEVTDEGASNPASETADVIESALNYAKQSYAKTKDVCGKLKVMAVAPISPTFANVEGIYFAHDSAALTETSKAVLDRAIVEFTNRSVVHVEVGAHTDSNGSEEHNIALSSRRAHSVMDYLISKGVDGSRLTSVGYGESTPRVSNETAEGRAKNRRVELRIKMQEQ